MPRPQTFPIGFAQMKTDLSPPSPHAPPTQLGLLRTRRFAPFFITQFLGAFNDNLFKNALVVLLTFHATSWTSLAPELLTNLAAGIFILPFFIFSASAGQLADKYDKAKLARLVKALEMLIMVISAAGFFAHDLALLLGALFLLGLHSTLFGPVKYAILPQHLHAHELVGGNALVEAGTFVAILVGTIAGGLLAGVGGEGGNPGWIAAAGLAVAAAGFVASCKIPAAPAPVPELKISLNPFTETWNNIAFARKKRTVFLAILGISWFWLYGALFLAQFPVYALKVLGGDETAVTLLLAVFTIGIGGGSMLCTRLSGKRVELGLVPFGALGLTLFALDLYFASPRATPAGAPLALAALLASWPVWRVLFDLLAIGVCGGFFIVPLYVILQTRSAIGHRARIIAANNIINALFMVVGALGAGALLGAGVSIPALFALAALANLVVAIYIYRLMPQFLLRFLAALLIRTIYRVEAEGLENIPERGPAVLVCNHISFIDPVVVVAAIQRPIRFVIDHQVFRIPVLSFFFRQLRTIPIAPNKEDPGQKEVAFRNIAQALRRGEMIGYFPEGGISFDGRVQVFRLGIERIIGDTPVPVIPIALRGLWGSFFSRQHGPAMSKPSKIRLRRQIGVRVGAAIAPAELTADSLRERVVALRGELW